MFNTATYNASPYNAFISALLGIVPPSITIAVLVEDLTISLDADPGVIAPRSNDTMTSLTAAPDDRALSSNNITTILG